MGNEKWSPTDGGIGASGPELLSSWTASSLSYYGQCCGLGLRQSTGVYPPGSRVNRGSAYVIAETSLRCILSADDWLWVLDGTPGPGPPLIIFKSASH